MEKQNLKKQISWLTMGACSTLLNIWVQFGFGLVQGEKGGA